MYAPYAVLSFFVALAYGYADPEGCSGACNVRDPGLMRRQLDGVYFLFSTGNKISYARAPALEGPWTSVGSALPNGSSINKPGKDDLWAPDLRNIDGIYHLYYAVSTSGSQDSAIGLATSDSMAAGTWIDHGSTGVATTAANNSNAIDPNLLDDGGTFYLTFGSFWGGIEQVPMNSAADKSTGDPYNLAYEPSDNHAIEGSYLYKNGEYYYLFYSAGICCGLDQSRPPAGDEYKIKVCRSSSPTGNFVDKSGTACTNGGGSIVLESHGQVYAPGGQGVFDDPEHGPILYYHYVNTTIGYADSQKLFGWNTIDFSSGWPEV